MRLAWETTNLSSTLHSSNCMNRHAKVCCIDVSCVYCAFDTIVAGNLVKFSPSIKRLPYGVFYQFYLGMIFAYSSVSFNSHHMRVCRYICSSIHCRGGQSYDSIFACMYKSRYYLDKFQTFCLENTTSPPIQCFDNSECVSC